MHGHVVAWMHGDRGLGSSWILVQMHGFRSMGSLFINILRRNKLKEDACLVMGYEVKPYT